MAHMIRTKLAKMRRFEAPKRPQHAFTVDHYAGKVTYSPDLLMAKNKVRTLQGTLCCCCNVVGMSLCVQQ